MKDLISYEKEYVMKNFMSYEKYLKQRGLLKKPSKLKKFLNKLTLGIPYRLQRLKRRIQYDLDQKRIYKRTKRKIKTYFEAGEFLMGNRFGYHTTGQVMEYLSYEYQNKLRSHCYDILEKEQRKRAREGLMPLSHQFYDRHKDKWI